MATEILATGTGALDSSDVTVAAGTPLTVSLKGLTGDKTALVTVSVKDDGNAYRAAGQLTSGNPSAILNGPGVYRFSRAAGSGTCGVFSA